MTMMTVLSTLVRVAGSAGAHSDTLKRRSEESAALVNDIKDL